MSWVYLVLAIIATFSLIGVASGIRNAMNVWSAWMIANMPKPEPSDGEKLEALNRKMLDLSGPDNSAR